MTELRKMVQDELEGRWVFDAEGEWFVSWESPKYGLVYDRFATEEMAQKFAEDLGEYVVAITGPEEMDE